MCRSLRVIKSSKTFISLGSGYVTLANSIGARADRIASKHVCPILVPNLVSLHTFWIIPKVYYHPCRSGSDEVG